MGISGVSLAHRLRAHYLAGAGGALGVLRCAPDGPVGEDGAAVDAAAAVVAVAVVPARPAAGSRFAVSSSSSRVEWAELIAAGGGGVGGGRRGSEEGGAVVVVVAVAGRTLQRPAVNLAVLIKKEQKINIDINFGIVYCIFLTPYRDKRKREICCNFRLANEPRQPEMPNEAAAFSPLSLQNFFFSQPSETTT